MGATTMRQLVLVCFFLLSLGAHSNAQMFVLGKVMDTASNTPLLFSSVILLQSSDSSIVSHARSLDGGAFCLKVPQPGNYQLLIRHPNFGVYREVLKVQKDTVQVGVIGLASKEVLLKEFVFKRQLAAIKIKGDTTEYIADSFNVKENATVEDLLKKLPGLQVDKNGKITAQGTEVNKVLVDGEEFFSDDPKVVTKGLQANAVDKVQVFDKKSDQAEFTGVDDGEKVKTINIELKESKKKGYFGKAEAGMGTKGYFENQGMINGFKGKRQLSAFGIMSNTDKAGLGWEDNDKFSSGFGMEMSDDGGMYYNNNEQDISGWDGKYNGEGLPKTWTGGVHYANKWLKDVHHLTGNYRYAKQNVEIEGQTITQYVLPNDKGFTQVQRKNQFSTGDKHGMDLAYDFKIDTNTSLKVTGGAGQKYMDTYSGFTTDTRSTTDRVININSRTMNTKAAAGYLSGTALLRRKMAKQGRSFSLDIRENYKEAGNTGFLNSQKLVPIDTTGSLPGIDTTEINQRKKNATNAFSLMTKAVYIEPIAKYTFLEANYSIQVSNSSSTTSSFDSTGPGLYNVINLDYSSDYQFNVTTNKGGLSLKYRRKKMTINFGSDISEAKFTQIDILNDYKVDKRKYVNLFPSAEFKYDLAKQTSLRMSYRGYTRQPSIEQLQPLQQNTDPLNQVKGNPGLKQEFTNTFRLNFNDYKVLSSRSLYASINYTTVNDAISSKQLNSNEGNITEYLNVDGNYNASANIGVGFKPKKGGPLYVHVSLNNSINRSFNIVNDTDNINFNNVYGISSYINYEQEDKFEITYNPYFTYTSNTSTISKFANSYWIFNNEFECDVQLSERLDIGTSLDVMIRQKTEVFDKNNNVVTWNAYAEYKMLKSKNLVLKANIYDIFNRNLGYSRTSKNGLITENTYNTIKRYGMLSLVWNFTHNPGGGVTKDE